jgi:oligosaccharide repeat unit polymerase
MLSYNAILYGTYILALLSILLFFVKNDELLLLFTGFFYSAGIERYNLVMSGRERWHYVAYAKDIFRQTDEIGHQALNYFFLGTACFVLFYFFLNINRKEVRKKIDDKKILTAFLDKYKFYIISAFALLAIFSFYSKMSFVNSFYSGNTSIAFGNSYSLMLGFAFGGFISITYLVFSHVDIKQGLISKILFGVILTYAAMSTYSSSGRFQFLSWSITIGIIFVRNFSPLKKLRFYIVGAFLVSTAFGLAGVLRSGEVHQLSFSQKIALAWERNNSREDQNMLDGFMMVIQVYPKHLGYHYGSEHLEILMRPIPRSWWPNKPLGGYANKLGLNDNMGGGSVGISQSLYGSFYGEGGVIGIIVFCFIYAYCFTLIFKSSEKYGSDVRYLIKGATIASCVPLLRGGDLPGIYAFIGMTFWPIFGFLYYYKKYIAKVNREKIQAFIQQQLNAKKDTVAEFS